MIPMFGMERWDGRFTAPSFSRCPRCSQAIGDGDRVTYGICGRCVMKRRRL